MPSSVSVPFTIERFVIFTANTNIDTNSTNKNINNSTDVHTDINIGTASVVSRGRCWGNFRREKKVMKHQSMEHQTIGWETTTGILLIIIVDTRMSL